jgi:uncharacterized protein involved in exopolysaccharide biosynthesis
LQRHNAPDPGEIEISLDALWSFYWNAKGLVILACLVALGLGATAYKLTPRTYRAEISVIPVVDAIGGAKGDVGTAGLSAISSLLGGGARTDWRQEQLALLQSRALAAAFIDRQGIIDELVPGPDTRELTPQDRQTLAITAWQKRVFRLTDDKLTGVVSLRIEWPEAQRSAALANAFVGFANDFVRSSTIRDSRALLALLEAEYTATQSVAARATLSALMERETKVLAIARTRPEFAFRTIDPARPSPRGSHATPNLVVYAGFTALGGVLLGTLAATLAATRRRGAGARHPPRSEPAIGASGAR